MESGYNIHTRYVNFIIITSTFARKHALTEVYRQHFCFAKIEYFKQIVLLMILKLTFKFNILNLCGCIYRLIYINLVNLPKL